MSADTIKNDWTNYLVSLKNAGYSESITGELKDLQTRISSLEQEEKFPTVVPLYADLTTAVEVFFYFSFCTLIIELHLDHTENNWCCLFTQPNKTRDYLKMSEDADEESIEEFYQYSLEKIINVISLMKILDKILKLGGRMPDEVILQEGDWYVGPCFGLDWVYSYEPGKWGNFIISYNREKNEYYYSSLESSDGKEFFGVVSDENLTKIIYEIHFLKSK